ncbi:copper resistance protein CopD [Cupriavidus sp. USMAHM13]|uniref:copper homeostasis membrane protein CopD n=1 Tax=Cupriavidus sp. USMAHM13 TaxID=1389192 RepID=UPI0008A6FC72|nr:copper homeostasis membrane protein CopD [Cupriavidus sp. USMAHM13]AOY98601.1 copper resistance protein CopD [Cupriavidus sp. USMAHM13]
MQVDWMNVLVRFALYLDLMLVFGLPLFACHALQGAERISPLARQYIKWTAAASAAGIMLSGIEMLVMAKAMTGASAYSDLSVHVFEMMVTGTGFGTAWSGRQIGLLASLLITLALARRPSAQIRLLALTGAVALSSLAWAGHGAMDDGDRRVIHLLADIAHLLAAGAWVGALAAFVLLGKATQRDATLLSLLARTAHGFARPGSVIVATLVVTGTANYWLIAGLPSASAMRTSYGMLLLIKLALFGTMLVMAALNRYRLTPRLAAEIRIGNAVGASRALRRSLQWEMATSIAVLVAVAILGVLSPDA